jgi:hypothetical protein
MILPRARRSTCALLQIQNTILRTEQDYKPMPSKTETHQPRNIHVAASRNVELTPEVHSPRPSRRMQAKCDFFFRRQLSAFLLFLSVLVFFIAYNPLC